MTGGMIFFWAAQTGGAEQVIQCPSCSRLGSAEKTRTDNLPGPWVCNRWWL